MATFALLKIIADSQRQLAAFDFGPRIPELSGEEAVIRVLRDYGQRHDDLYDLFRPDAVETLRKLLCEHRDDPLLATSVRAAGDLGIDQLIPCIQKLRDHANPDVVLSVIGALGQLASLEDVQWLGGFATDANPEFRRQAALALGKIPHETVPPVLNRFVAADPDLWPEVDFGKKKIARFISPTPESVREMVLLDLASDEYEDLVPKARYVAKALDDLIKDAEASNALKVRAVRVLGLARLAPLAETYFWILAQPDASTEIRYEAIVALGRLRMRGADELLLEQVHTAELPLRIAAIDALGRIGKGSTLDPLLECWDLEGGALRPALAATARTLAKFDGAPLLASALDSNRPAPGDALYFIEEKSVTRGLRSDETIAHLHDSAIEGRRDAALLLAFFGGPEAAALLRDLAERETDSELRDIALRGVARLQRVV